LTNVWGGCTKSKFTLKSIKKTETITLSRAGGGGRLLTRRGRSLAPPPKGGVIILLLDLDDCKQEWRPHIRKDVEVIDVEGGKKGYKVDLLINMCRGIEYKGTFKETTQTTLETREIMEGA